MGLVGLVLLIASLGSTGDAGYSLWGLLAVGGSVALFISGKSISAKKRPAWLEKVKMYEHGWVCLQCGHSWIIP